MSDSRQQTADSRLVPAFFLLSAVCCLLSASAHAAYSSKDLFIPIFGHTVGGDGRRYDTAFTLTNPSSRVANVKLSFLAAGQPNPNPYTIGIRLLAKETRRYDPVGADLLGAPAAFGALRIESDIPLLAHARLFSTMPGEPVSRSIASSFNAIPQQFSVGTGESALLQGIDQSADFRYKIYVVETTGHPLTFALSLLDANGRVVATTHEYVSSHEERSWDIADEFRGARGAVLLRVNGMNGDGRVIAAGVQIATGSQDGTAYEMSFVTTPRWRLPAGEVAAYIIAGAALIVAIIFGRRSS
jgi:hypothetical protein